MMELSKTNNKRVILIMFKYLKENTVMRKKGTSRDKYNVYYLPRHKVINHI